jgi:polyisoprenyl-teichoic acid--peptidoglycan teichoic acid transferase
MDDERPPLLWWSMWKRFLIAAVLIVALSAGATATVTLNTVSSLAAEVFPALSHIKTPQGLVTPEYDGGPRTFLVLGSDRRERSKDAFDREDPPHSDTILLVRFDPEQGQTSVLSIPRDLLVTITTKGGQSYPNEKINAAYTIGSKEGGTGAGALLAAETIKREVFPSLRLNAIVDVNFRGFMELVDTLGCAYVQVDHRYFNENVGTPETNYTSINLEPGYQRLCYENALDYVRYRHTDSDFVRVARQQDFLRELREQIDPGRVLGQLETVAKAVGHAITTTLPSSSSELIELAKMLVFSQAKPVRQVKFRTSSIETVIDGVDYVSSTPELERATLEEFLDDHASVELPSSPPRSARGSARARHRPVATAVAGLAPTGQSGRAEVAKAAISTPFRVLYPGLQTEPALQQQARAYTLTDEQGRIHHAYVVVWQQNPVGGYYDMEGTDWLDPPIFKNARVQMIDGRSYEFVDDGVHIHVIGWREDGALYWLTNTLLEELSNRQMLAIAKSSRALG